MLTISVANMYSASQTSSTHSSIDRTSQMDPSTVAQTTDILSTRLMNSSTMKTFHNTTTSRSRVLRITQTIAQRYTTRIFKVLRKKTAVSNMVSASVSNNARCEIR